MTRLHKEHGIKKILVVGYGSMGRRRIRLFSELVETAEVICVDQSRERLEQARKAGLKACASLEKGIQERPDIAFVCTSPGCHKDIIIKLIESKIHVFTELNLSNDGYAQIIAKAKDKHVTVFMSNTLLYKRQIEFIHKLVKGQKKPIAYIYHVGQYLPDWHPWENYKDFFAGYNNTNGVREILAIQMPWMVNTFGSIDSFHAERQRCTGLDIDFPDMITISFRHKNGNLGMFTADVTSRKAVTRLEVIGEDMHLFWDGHNDDLYQLNIKSGNMEQIKVYETEEHMEGYSDNIAEQPYRDEISEFLAVVGGKKVPRYSLEEDNQVISLIDQIEGRG